MVIKLDLVLCVKLGVSSNVLLLSAYVTIYKCISVHTNTCICLYICGAG